MKFIYIVGKLPVSSTLAHKKLRLKPKRSFEINCPWRTAMKWKHWGCMLARKCDFIPGRHQLGGTEDFILPLDCRTQKKWNWFLELFTPVFGIGQRNFPGKVRNPQVLTMWSWTRACGSCLEMQNLGPQAWVSTRSPGSSWKASWNVEFLLNLF